MTFEQLELNQKTKRALGDMGYINPTPIQKQAIPMVLDNCETISKR